MVWPTGGIATTNMDADGDSPLAARQQIKATVDALNQILGHVSGAAADVLAQSSVDAMRSTLGAVSSSDGRLSDSREWTASTVTQAEAEARSATTRRAWTAERVGQAISAFWSALSAIDGKPIGQTTPAFGAFTDLRVGASVSGNGPTQTIGPDYTGSYGYTSVPRLKVNSTTNGAMVAVGRWSPDNLGAVFGGFKSRGAAIGVNEPVLMDDHIVRFSGGAYDTSAVYEAGYLALRASENWSQTNRGAYWDVVTRITGGTGLVTKARFGPRVLLGSTVDDGVADVQINGTGAVTGDFSAKGNFLEKQPAPAAVNTTSTLATSALLGRLIQSAPSSAASLTLPSGTTLDAALTMAANQSFDWSVINTGTATATVLAGASGHTVVGAMAVAAGVSALFRTRKSAAGTFITYRVS